MKRVQSVMVLKRKMGGWFLLWLTTSVIVDDTRRVFSGVTSTAPFLFSLFSSQEQAQYDRFSLPNGTGYRFMLSGCGFRKWEKESSIRRSGLYLVFFELKVCYGMQSSQVGSVLDLLPYQYSKCQAYFFYY